MKNHVKVYYEHFGYGEQDVILCEYCGYETANSVHHIEPRKSGGSKKMDYVENLIALCCLCHRRAEFVEYPIITKKELKLIVANRG